MMNVRAYAEQFCGGIVSLREELAVLPKESGM